jgi:hypothetical protein
MDSNVSATYFASIFNFGEKLGSVLLRNQDEKRRALRPKGWEGRWRQFQVSMINLIPVT